MNINEKGYFIYYRSVFEGDDWLSEPFTKAQAWIDLVSYAHWDIPKSMTKNGQEITLNRGQVIESERFFTTRWRWSRTKFQQFMKKAEKKQKIIIKKATPNWHITICNYEEINALPNLQKATENQEKSTEKTQEKQPYIDNYINPINSTNPIIKNNPKDQNNIEKGGMGGKTNTDFSKYEKRDFAKLNQKPKHNLNDPELTMRFETFWNAYPKQANKKFALEAFAEALTLSDFQTILDSAERFKKYHREQSTEMKFIKSPDKWLSGEHWRDKLMLKEEIEYLEKLEADRKYEENQALLKKMIEESKQKNLTKKDKTNENTTRISME